MVAFCHFVISYSRELKNELEDGEYFLIYFPDLTKFSKSPIYASVEGISAFDAGNNVKYLLKTSYRNTKMHEDFIPMLATVEEANSFAATHGCDKVEHWHTGDNMAVTGGTEDSTFDVASVKKRKHHLVTSIKEEISMVTPPAKAKLGKVLKH